jgi:hypothetical protein
MKVLRVRPRYSIFPLLHLLRSPSGLSETPLLDFTRPKDTDTKEDFYSYNRKYYIRQNSIATSDTDVVYTVLLDVVHKLCSIALARSSSVKDEQTEKMNARITWAESVEDPAESGNQEEYVLERFKEYRKLEHNKLQRLRAKNERIQIFNSLKRFSETFKLKTVMPQDIASLLNKSPTKPETDQEAHSPSAEVQLPAGSSDRDQDLCHIGAQFEVTAVIVLGISSRVVV